MTRTSFERLSILGALPLIILWTTPMASADPQLPTLTVSQAFTLAWYRDAPAPTFEGFKFEAGQDDKVLMRITLGQNAAGQIIQSNFALTALPGQLNLLADYVEHSSGQVFPEPKLVLNELPETGVSPISTPSPTSMPTRTRYFLFIHSQLT
ncbi:hypothetical protein PM082_012546 [Marasmius tenuissimus]|nr:hypothetical protein PM082_012546 [Marasmius tenuissimus]